MSFFKKLGRAVTAGAKAVASGAKAVISNPIVSTVGNIVAPGAFSLAAKAANTAAGIVSPTTRPAMPISIPKLIAPSASINAPPVAVSLTASTSPSRGLGGLIDKIAPNYRRNTDAIIGAFRKG